MTTKMATKKLRLIRLFCIWKPIHLLHFRILIRFGKFQDFPGYFAEFQDFPLSLNDFGEFQYFPGIPRSLRTLIDAHTIRIFTSEVQLSHEFFFCIRLEGVTTPPPLKQPLPQPPKIGSFLLYVIFNYTFPPTPPPPKPTLKLYSFFNYPSREIKK